MAQKKKPKQVQPKRQPAPESTAKTRRPKARNGGAPATKADQPKVRHVMVMNGRGRKRMVHLKDES